MNVSVVRKKVCLLYYLCLFFWMRNFYFLLLTIFLFVCLFHTVWSLAIVRVKFCNNIKRRLSIIMP